MELTKDLNQQLPVSAPNKEQQHLDFVVKKSHAGYFYGWILYNKRKLQGVSASGSSKKEVREKLIINMVAAKEAGETPLPAGV